MNEKINFEEELKKCKTMEDLLGKNGLIKRMIKGTLEGMLQAELENHLGYEKSSKKGNNSGNSRNGKSRKNVKSTFGEVPIEIPRDRNGTYEPLAIPKYKTDISDFDQKIISMYAKGMTTRDIQDHILDIYGVDVSPAMVSMITDKVIIHATEWQSRILATLYPIIFFDAIHFKVRENGKVITKASYTCLGIDAEGKKDILGIWIGENEGATFWLSVFNELKNRGVQDGLIACMDGLKGLPEAIKAVFPQVQVQLCIIHMIRNSMKYVGSKNKKEFMNDLKEIYQAPSRITAETALSNLQYKWLKIYPLAVNPWLNHWENVAGYFAYPADLRRLIYTTNAIESLHRQLRKVTKNRAVLNTDQALFKLLYLAGQDIQKKWTHSIRDWQSILTQLLIIFKGRLTIN